MITALAGLPAADAVLMVIATAYPMLWRQGQGGACAGSTSVEFTLRQIAEARRHR